MLQKNQKLNSSLFIFALCSAVIVYMTLNSSNKDLIQIKVGGEWGQMTIDTR